MLVSLSNVGKTYRTSDGGVAAVQEIDLQVDAGEFIAVCGPSGCGKSTLLLLIGGLLTADTGSVSVDGVDWKNLNANERAAYRAKMIGFVFQQFHLIPYLSVADNVLSARIGARELVSANTGKDVAVEPAVDRANGLLERFGLEGRRHHRPGQLSTGERQRVALARALLNQPKLLLADEPTGNLDPANTTAVLDQLRSFADDGGAVLMVTHQQEAANRADRIVRLDTGRLQ